MPYKFQIELYRLLKKYTAEIWHGALRKACIYVTLFGSERDAQHAIESKVTHSSKFVHITAPFRYALNKTTLKTLIKLFD